MVLLWKIDHIYEAGKLVFVRKTDADKSSKWDGANEGPFPVIEVHNNNTLIIDRFDYLDRINFRRGFPW